MLCSPGTFVFPSHSGVRAPASPQDGNHRLSREQDLQLLTSLLGGLAREALQL